ncbi:hypothetical protein M408DRAFT_330730 [Serendipita vermifera MAFF 305830]|uniref:DUF676 domain-containing protein n=1 Tax=Serendipita vermifera MAFF 305830 TaxID=933852 RepID=A0A0C3B3V6_SERVB|nr:hypothetical protein M408DRAFT_330730 [Serendipita vermifera MAFF 305830]
MQELHLLVASHGMWGEPAHLGETARVIRSKFSEVDGNGVRLHVLVSKINTLGFTYDGIDWGGERLAEEVLKEIEELEKDGLHKVTRFSAVGYSMGGLLVRYMIGILNQRKFFEHVRPINFTTFAAPNIGLVRTGTVVSKLEFKIMPKVMSRTGPQFYGLDSWSATGQPLIEVLADPKGVFYQGLAKFEHLSLYGSAYGDKTVPYSTALIESKDPFYNHETNGMTITMHKKYPPIMISYDTPAQPPTPEPKPPIASRAYWRSKPSTPLLPPFLQFKPPLNILFYATLPLLVPVGVTAIYVKLTVDSHKSRKRIRRLEAEESSKDRLANVLKRTDMGMENAVAQLIEGAGEKEESPLKSAKNRAQLHTQSTSASGSSGGGTPPLAQIVGQDRSPAGSKAPGGPAFSPMQLKAIDSLNQLPFNKYVACFPHVFSSHHIIVSRDLRKQPSHEQGLPVLQHWADHFIL